MDKRVQKEMSIRRSLARLGRHGIQVELHPRIFLEALNLNVYDNANLNKRHHNGIYIHTRSFVDDYNFVTYTSTAITDSEDMQKIPSELEAKWEEF